MKEAIKFIILLILGVGFLCYSSGYIGYHLHENNNGWSDCFETYSTSEAQQPDFGKYPVIINGVEIIKLTFPNKNARDYAIKIAMPSTWYTDHGFIFGEDKINHSYLLLLIEELSNIKGVTEVWTGDYEIGLRKAEAFDWEEIEPQALKILVKYLK